MERAAWTCFNHTDPRYFLNYLMAGRLSKFFLTYKADHVDSRNRVA